MIEWDPGYILVGKWDFILPLLEKWHSFPYLKKIEVTSFREKIIMALKSKKTKKKTQPNIIPSKTIPKCLVDLDSKIKCASCLCIGLKS